MASEKPEGAKRSVRSDPLKGVDTEKRQLLKLALAGTAAYVLPVMASFSLDGLGVTDDGDDARLILTQAKKGFGKGKGKGKK